VIAKRIHSSAWIGSVLALHELYAKAHTDPDYRKNLRLVTLKFVYDWKSKFEPWINKLVYHLDLFNFFKDSKI
jgi:hypothetical protein